MFNLVISLINYRTSLGLSMSQAFSVMFENERKNCCVDKYSIG